MNLGEIHTIPNGYKRAMKPLALDLCCGKGGWAKGLIAAGWNVIGVDIDERFRAEYPGQFYCGDVLGRDCGALIPSSTRLYDLVVASPPCQEFSRHDQPWTRKRNPPPPDTSIWEACVRIAAECGAPLILENVRGAQRWMGKAQWHFGSQYLWGDVPALMPKHPGWKAVRQKQSMSSTARATRAMVPFDLALHIGKVFHPGEERCA